MLGQMMHRPLCTSTILTHARTAFPEARVISRGHDKAVSSLTFTDLSGRVARLAHWLVAAGIGSGERVATLAWNDHRHLELYYAIAGIGAVCHTVNPRLPVANIAYIIEHAEDRLLLSIPAFCRCCRIFWPGCKTRRALSFCPNWRTVRRCARP